MVLYIRALCGRLIYVETCMNILVYKKLHRDMLGYAVVFWALMFL